MRELRTTDYIICAFGMIGALEIFGLLGRHLSILRPVFLLTSIAIALFSVTVLVYEWFADILTPTERRIYLFYVFTNSLPVLALWILGT